ncbi:PadR family transcriptional regulator [Kineococcus sp. LSe6-4]|uniref:PadR family transcriptional regulator n=1 Tax=Kineococcus halophytocola TaxID=3234027 RepID=A0ABV4GY55_9ACTN
MASSEMREPTFLLLTALAGQPQHGYALTQEVAHLSGGRVRLKPGTLYAALDRLADEGLIALSGEEVVDGRLRRYYSLTSTGAGTLERETQRLRANVEAATVRLRTHGATSAATSQVTP